MSARAVSLNTKIDPQEKELFIDTCESLGMTPSSAIKVFVRVFNETGGFPFELRKGFPKSTTLDDDIETAVPDTAKSVTLRAGTPEDDRPRGRVATLFDEPATQDRTPVQRTAPKPLPQRSESLSAPRRTIRDIPQLTREPLRQDQPIRQEEAPQADANDTAVLNRRELDAVMESVYGSVPQGSNGSPDKTNSMSRQHFEDLDEPYGANFNRLRGNEMPDARPRGQRYIPRR